MPVRRITVTESVAEIDLGERRARAVTDAVGQHRRRFGPANGRGIEWIP